MCFRWEDSLNVALALKVGPSAVGMRKGFVLCVRTGRSSSNTSPLLPQHAFSAASPESHPL